MAALKEVLLMSGLLMLSRAQMRRIEPYFPLPHGVPRVDDRRILSGIVFVIRNGLRWRDAPAAYGPHKTIYNRFIRWSRLGVFNKIFSALAATSDADDVLMIDATHLKAHRTAASLLKKGLFPDISEERRAA
jgi:transposase